MPKTKSSKTNVLADALYYRRLFAYNRKVLRSYLSAISKQPWKTVTKNMEATHYSIVGIFIHILGVYNGWLNYNLYGKSGEIPTETLNIDNYRSAKDLERFMNTVWKGIDKLIDDLDDDYVSKKKVRAPWMPGNHSLSDVLMQVSLEQAHHIGEIIALFWQLDIEPPEMTWIMNTRKN